MVNKKEVEEMIKDTKGTQNETEEEQDRAGTGERQCLKLNKTGPYPEEMTAAKDRDKDGTVTRGHDYMCYVCVWLCLHMH